MQQDTPAGRGEGEVGPAAATQAARVGPAGVGRGRVAALGVAALGAGDPGREVRWLLLALLLVTLTCEQMLALHMSYHPEGT